MEIEEIGLKVEREIVKLEVRRFEAWLSLVGWIEIAGYGVVAVVVALLPLPLLKQQPLVDRKATD